MGDLKIQTSKLSLACERKHEPTLSSIGRSPGIIDQLSSDLPGGHLSDHCSDISFFLETLKKFLHSSSCNPRNLPSKSYHNAIKGSSRQGSLPLVLLSSAAVKSMMPGLPPTLPVGHGSSRRDLGCLDDPWCMSFELCFLAFPCMCTSLPVVTLI